MDDEIKVSPTFTIKDKNFNYQREIKKPENNFTFFLLSIILENI